MKIKKADVNSLLKAIEYVVDIKMIIRQITPHYELNDLLEDKFVSSLQKLHNILNPIFSTYLPEEPLKGEKSREIGRQRIQNALTKDNRFLLSSNSAKKVLKDLGADPRNIIVSGGPFFLEDYQKVNPNIPDHALVGIQKKCERLKEELSEETWRDKDLYFIYEQNDIADQLTLEKIDRISELIGREVKTIDIESWDDLAE
jgi:hypothetical protein